MSTTSGEPEVNDDYEAGFGMVPRYLRGRLTAHQIAVYVALTWRANRHGQCWLSHQRLADEAGTSKSTAKRSLDELRAAGIVTWEPMYRPDGSVQCNRYTLHVFGSGRSGAARAVTPGGHTDLPPGSHGPTPGVTGTHRTRFIEQDPLNVPQSGTGDGPGATDGADAIDAIEAAVNGYERGEELLAFSMLEKGCHPKNVVNAIELQRTKYTARFASRSGVLGHETDRWRRHPAAT